MTYWRVSHDPYDGGPTYTVKASTEREARRIARAQSASDGWRVGSVDVDVIPADNVGPAFGQVASTNILKATNKAAQTLGSLGGKSACRESHR